MISFSDVDGDGMVDVRLTLSGNRIVSERQTRPHGE